MREKRLKEVRSRIVELQRGLEKRSATPPATFPQDIDGMLADTKFTELANEENEVGFWSSFGLFIGALLEPFYGRKFFAASRRKKGTS